MLLALALPTWLDPDQLLRTFGPWALWGVAAFVFAECGLFAFLPGDSLLFTLGLFVAAGYLHLPLPLACLVLTAAAVLGNASGYGLGRLIGPPLFRPRPGLVGRILDQRHVDRTRAFLDRYGPRALVLARFVPIVRTFVTLVAGVTELPFRTFILYSAVGGVVWASGVTVLGYYLGSVPLIRDHLQLVLLAIVAVSLVPMAVEFLRARRRRRTADA